jgi:hypothetical protein
MSSIKKFRFPILVGSGILAAGVLIYVANNRVNSRQVQGAIGQRDVYRDGQVSAADIGKPGDAPVVAKALMESKDFQELAKNESFRRLLEDESFKRLARNARFAALLQDSNFMELMRSKAFLELMRKSDAELAKHLETGDSHQRSAKKSESSDSHQMMRWLSAEDAQALSRSKAFQEIRNRSEFLELMRSRDAAQDMASWGARWSSDSELIRSKSFQRLLDNSAFRSALDNGTARRLSSEMHARLSSDLKQAAAKK